MTNTKITYVDALNTVLTALDNVDLNDLPDKVFPAIDRVKELRDSIAKRNSKKADAPKKPTKTQQENATLAVKVAEFLREQDEPMTCKAIAEQFGVSVQKMSAILKLVPTICKEVVKGVTMFSVQ